MTKSFATLAAAAALLFSAAEAHNAFTTIWINGKSQGDATCVRTTNRRNAPNTPVVDLTSKDIVCGVNGLEPVAYTCAAPQGSTLTFEYRISPDKAGSGFIDPGHKGPAAVYAKKLGSPQNSGEGDGWFKIWSEGYDAKTDLWATEKLIKENGFLSIIIPESLPAGDYLFRPEVVAMHNVTPAVEPQFYVGCAQVFLESPVTTELSIPNEYRVSMPGYLKRDDLSMTYNIYDDEEYANPKKPYPEAGPKAWAPAAPQVAAAGSNVVRQAEGAVAKSCLLVNGNWCGVATPSYENDLTACWASQDNCWKQNDACWKSAPITGGANCELWSNKCKAHGAACKAGVKSGPPAFNFDLSVRTAPKFAPPKNAGSAAVVAASPAVTSPTATATVLITDAPLASLYPSTLLTSFSLAPVPTDVYVAPPPPGLITTTTIVLAAPLPTGTNTFPVQDLSIDPSGNLVTLVPFPTDAYTAFPTSAVPPIVTGCPTASNKKRSHKRHNAHGQHKRRHTE